MDAFNIEILPDGTIKSETDKVSGPNHQTAESFLKTLATLAGGRVERTRKPGAPLEHTHDGKHWHSH